MAARTNRMGEATTRRMQQHSTTGARTTRRTSLGGTGIMSVAPPDPTTVLLRGRYALLARASLGAVARGGRYPSESIEVRAGRLVGAGDALSDGLEVPAPDRR